jgi:excisionase family DNA binding protein
MPNDTRLNLTPAELARAFDGVPPVLSPDQLAKVLGLSVKTIYGWMEQGRLDGAFRRRGKRCLIVRNRAMDIIFNGKSWSTSNE